MKLAQRIKTARKAAGISQGQLAESLNVSQGTISGWENEDNEPPRTRIPKLAEALNKHPIWIEFGDLYPIPGDFDYPKGLSDSASQAVTKTIEKGGDLANSSTVRSTVYALLREIADSPYREVHRLNHTDLSDIADLAVKASCAAFEADDPEQVISAITRHEFKEFLRARKIRF